MGSMAWKIIGTGGAILAGVAARKATIVGWKLLTGNEPPANPEDPDVTWPEAIGFATATGIAVGLARLAWNRKAADYYIKSTGERPANLQQTT